MTSSTTTTALSLNRAPHVLLLTLIVFGMSSLGFFLGWDAARAVEPVQFSFECEPAAPI